jgi:hypothetical protein
MTVHVVTYPDPNPKRGIPSQRTFEITADSDVDARNKFMQFSWVAWTPITVDKVESKTLEKIQAGEQKALPPMPNWRADAQALSQRIGQLSATAIADAKASRHDAARMAPRAGIEAGRGEGGADPTRHEA